MGVVPFRQDGGQILDRAGTVLATVNFDAWATGSTQGIGGQVDTWEGVCEPQAAQHVVGKSNRFFLANGIKYRVDDAIDWPDLGYVELRLRDPRAHG